MNKIEKIFSEFFPFYNLICANRIVKKEIQSNNHKWLIQRFFTDARSPMRLTVNEASELYAREFSRKDKLENKAQMNIFAVTLSVTLIMEAFTLTNNIAKKYPSIYIFIISIVLFIAAVAYMAFAGVGVSALILEENITYQRNRGLTSEKKIRKDYINTICLNRAQNTIRNNYLSASYVCIRNALICLFMVMLIAVFPYNLLGGENKHSVSVLNYNFFYSPVCDSTIIAASEEREYIESFIIRKLITRGIDASHPVSIIDNSRSLLIKFSVDGNIINVHLVERYME